MYRAPHAKFISALMAELIASLNSRDEVPVFVRAAMAHLNLAAIHPFRDGNGRMARALQTFVLARDGISAPPFASIDEYLSVNTGEYYRILDEVDEGAWQPERDARPWVRFCLTAHWLQARTLLKRTEEYDRLWEELEREVKHCGLAERTTFALAEAAIGGSLTAALHQSTAGGRVSVPSVISAMTILPSLPPLPSAPWQFAQKMPLAGRARSPAVSSRK